MPFGREGSNPSGAIPRYHMVMRLHEMTEEEAHALLGTTPQSTEQDVKAAYRALTKQLHPDVGGSFAAFTNLSRALQTIRQARSQKSQAALQRIYADTELDPGRPMGGSGRGGSVAVGSAVDVVVPTTGEKLYSGIVQRRRHAGIDGWVFDVQVAKAYANDYQDEVGQTSQNIAASWLRPAPALPY